MPIRRAYGNDDPQATSVDLEQRRFRDLLMPYPTLARYWDWQTLLRRGRRMPRWGLVSWRAHGHVFPQCLDRRRSTPLGLIEAVNTLDTEDLSVIIGWMRDPFFPNPVQTQCPHE